MLLSVARSQKKKIIIISLVQSLANSMMKCVDYKKLSRLQHSCQYFKCQDFKLETYSYDAKPLSTPLVVGGSMLPDVHHGEMIKCAAKMSQIHEILGCGLTFRGGENMGVIKEEVAALLRHHLPIGVACVHGSTPLTRNVWPNSIHT